MNDLLRALIQDVIDSTCSNGVVETSYVDKLADYLAANPPRANPPRDRCPECNELRGRLHHPTCGKRAGGGATYVLCVDCEDTE